MSGIITYLRSFRIANIAIFDVASTYLVAYYVAKYYNLDANVTFGQLILLGIAVHYVLGINTQLNYDLGLSNPPIRN